VQMKTEFCGAVRTDCLLYAWFSNPAQSATTRPSTGRAGRDAGLPGLPCYHDIPSEHRAPLAKALAQMAALMTWPSTAVRTCRLLRRLLKPAVIPQELARAEICARTALAHDF